MEGVEDTTAVDPALEVGSSPLDGWALDTGLIGVLCAGDADDTPPVAAGDEDGGAGELSADPDFVIAIPPEPSVVVGSDWPGTELEAAEDDGEDVRERATRDGVETATEDGGESIWLGGAVW